MKAKISVSISIVLMVVILATILSLSFAWFAASNPKAFATNGQFTAAETESASANINISSVIDYGGETGVDLARGDLDYPYKAYYTFNISFKPQFTSVVTNLIKTVDIKLSGETEPSISSTNPDTSDIINNFSWDLYLVKQVKSDGTTTTTVDGSNSFFPAGALNIAGNDWYYKTGDTEPQPIAGKYTLTHYYSDDCFGKEDNIVRDIDGNPLRISGSYLRAQQYTFVIEITFLDKASYCAHCSQSGVNHPADCPNKNGSINAFAYSDPSYMNCRFSIGIDIGFTRQTPTTGGGTN